MIADIWIYFKILTSIRDEKKKKQVLTKILRNAQQLWKIWLNLIFRYQILKDSKESKNSWENKNIPKRLQE